uniref:Si:dkey-9i23.5 n=1 Tax=Hucho hucho TaxID=62062 RepID=A0A4W5NU03_9TELE
MKFFSLIVMMSLLGTKMALTFHRSASGDDAPVDFQEETTGCDLPRACDLKNYEDWYRLGSYCVKYYKTLLNFTEAELQCRSAAPGGHLVSVHNDQANTNLLCVVMKSNAKSPRIWLGGFELFKSGKFVWTDGSSWNFEAWTPGEPISRWTSHEDCVEMNWSSKRWMEGGLMGRREGWMDGLYLQWL